MNLRIIAITENGIDQAKKICSALPDIDVDIWNRDEKSREEYTEEAFREGLPMLFIGASGIAVRTIAPFVNDKLTDSPVLVMDEFGLNIIPILSGHYGGANELAIRIAEAINANPVITTATDINGTFSVDVFAKENNLGIVNRDGIAKVSTKALQGKPVRISIGSYAEDVDVSMPEASLYLRPLAPKGIVLGIGCKKGTGKENIKKFINKVLEENDLDINDVSAIASIDLKSAEEGLVDFAKEMSLPFITFDATALSKAEADFTASEFVRDTTGVDNVCERAAVLAAGPGGELIVRKEAGDGITLAASVTRGFSVKRDPAIFVVGLGPGDESMITPFAAKAIEDSDVIIGYNLYLDLIRDRYPDKRMLSTPMRQEIERCRMCYEEALKGNRVSMVCSGDPGIYGMASIMMELKEEYQEAKDVELTVVPGVTAALSGSAVLGAPLNHDFVVISLSDLLTPWDVIEKRLRAAAEGDFAICLYNPSSKKRKDHLKRACEILLEKASPDTASGIVRNIGRVGEEYKVMTLEELKETEVDMFTTCFIGNSNTRILDGRLATPRGYKLKRE